MILQNPSRLSFLLFKQMKMGAFNSRLSETGHSALINDILESDEVKQRPLKMQNANDRQFVTLILSSLPFLSSKSHRNLQWISRQSRTSNDCATPNAIQSPFGRFYSPTSALEVHSTPSTSITSQEAAGNSLQTVSTSKSIGILKNFETLRVEDVQLPCEVLGDIQNWKKNWASFFESREINFSACNYNDPEAFLTERYTNTLTVKSRRVLDRIRWRILMLFFYELHQIIRKDSILVDVISKRGHFDSTELSRNISHWIGYGQRYQKLANLLNGCGCLFFLPESINDRM